MTKCGKDRPKVDDETQTIQDNVLAKQEFMRIMPTTNDKAIKQKGVGSSSGKILKDDETKFEYRNSITGQWKEIEDTVSQAVLNQILDVSPVPGPKFFRSFIDSVKITSEFDGSKPSPDGSTRNGKVITLMTKSSPTVKIPLFGEENSSYKSRLIQYSVNGIVYNGEIEVYNFSKTLTTTKVNNGTCTKSGVWNSAYSNLSARKVTWLKGKNHPTDVSTNGEEFKIEEADPNGGGTIGISRDGLPYTVKIISPLTFNSNAKYGITGGIVQLTPDGKKTRTIDYSQISSGVVVFTVDGNSFTVNLSQ